LPAARELGARLTEAANIQRISVPGALASCKEQSGIAGDLVRDADDATAASATGRCGRIEVNLDHLF
jgi:hypothetical protein